jgi:DNA adenine methylase
MRMTTTLVDRALTPPLKWAGGKRWQVPHLQPLWDAARAPRLVEPFCGGLAVALGLRPREALLNDINPHLVNFYRQLREGFTVPAPFHNAEGEYYRSREAFNALLREGKGDTPEAAALFYYLNRTGYNGLCRFNRDGLYNVPFGRYARIGYKYDFSEFRDLFARWEFTSLCFDQVPLEPSDFVYADPPYDVEFRQYAKDGFGWAEQERLARWLTTHRGPVVLANQATPRIVELYRSLGYRLDFHHAPRRISCTGDRRPAREVLATRNLP